MTPVAVSARTGDHKPVSATGEFRLMLRDRIGPALREAGFRSSLPTWDVDSITRRPCARERPAFEVVASRRGRVHREPFGASGTVVAGVAAGRVGRRPGT